MQQQRQILYSHAVCACQKIKSDHKLVLTQLNQAPSLYFAYALGRNYLNEEYCDMFIPEINLLHTNILLLEWLCDQGCSIKVAQWPVKSSPMASQK